MSNKEIRKEMEMQIEKFKAHINQRIEAFKLLVPYTKIYTEEHRESLIKLLGQLEEIEAGKRERLEGFTAVCHGFSFVALERSRAKKMVNCKAAEVFPDVKATAEKHYKFWDDFYNLFLFEDEKEI